MFFLFVDKMLEIDHRIPLNKILQVDIKKRRKTRIICTLGPASKSISMCEELLKAGMNVARFDFSYGSLDDHQEIFDNLRIAMHNTGILAATMLDIKGPEIRTGFLKDSNPVQLKEGQEITISTDVTIKGDGELICMSYKKLPYDVKPQSQILCADGTIMFTVLSCDTDNGLVRCRCENTAVLKEEENVNLPGVIVDLPALTEKDKDDIIKWGVPNKVDMIAISFVRKGSDLVEVRKLLGEYGKSILLVSKVKNQEGVDNLYEILANSDVFMLTLDDLHREVPIGTITQIQKTMIRECNLQGKPVVTASAEMLNSMMNSVRPTEAEVKDVANAVIDGTDCVMLCGVTATGANPKLAVQTMARICIEVEHHIKDEALYKKILKASVSMSQLEIAASSVVGSAYIAKASTILVLTRGYNFAKLVAKYRPAIPILSIVECLPKKNNILSIIESELDIESSSYDSLAMHSLIFRGLVLVLIERTEKAYSAAEADKLGFDRAKRLGLCKDGDYVVVVHGDETTPFVRVVKVV